MGNKNYLNIAHMYDPNLLKVKGVLASERDIIEEAAPLLTEVMVEGTVASNTVERTAAKYMYIV